MLCCCSFDKVDERARRRRIGGWTDNGSVGVPPTIEEEEGMAAKVNVLALLLCVTPLASPVRAALFSPSEGVVPDGAISSALCCAESWLPEVTPPTSAPLIAGDCGNGEGPREEVCCCGCCCSCSRCCAAAVALTCFCWDCCCCSCFADVSRSMGSLMCAAEVLVTTMPGGSCRPPPPPLFSKASSITPSISRLLQVFRRNGREVDQLRAFATIRSPSTSPPPSETLFLSLSALF